MWMNDGFIRLTGALAALVVATLVATAQPATTQTRPVPAAPAPPMSAPAVTPEGEPSAAGLWQQIDEKGQSQGWFLIAEKNTGHLATLRMQSRQMPSQ